MTIEDLADLVRRYLDENDISADWNDVAKKMSGDLDLEAGYSYNEVHDILKEDIAEYGIDGISYV